MVLLIAACTFVGVVLLVCAYSLGAQAKDRECTRLLEQNQNRKNESERRQRELDRIQALDQRTSDTRAGLVDLSERMARLEASRRKKVGP